jgi:hypothetical protein
MSHAPTRRALRCPNCDASLELDPAPLFCPHCGQETALHPPTFFEFVHEFADHYVAIEGSLWRTLWALLAHPGRLTVEYLAGRRRRYVPPLRLYLSASFLFFLIVKVLGSSSAIHFQVAPIDAHGKPITSRSDPANFAATMAEMRRCVDVPGSCSRIQTLGAKIGLKAGAQSEHPEATVQHFIGYAPYAVFGLLPLFAAFVMWVYLRRHLAYGAHFVFSLHMHSVLFLGLLLVALLPGAASLVVLALLPVYGVWALQRVFGGRWWATVLRAVTLACLYGVALVITMQILGVAAILMS